MENFASSSPCKWNHDWHIIHDHGISVYQTTALCSSNNIYVIPVIGHIEVLRANVGVSFIKRCSRNPSKPEWRPHRLPPYVVLHHKCVQCFWVKIEPCNLHWSWFSRVSKFHSSQVIFAPRKPGNYVAQLLVTSRSFVTGMGTQAVDNMLGTVTLLGSAETPQVEVSFSPMGITSGDF